MKYSIDHDYHLHTCLSICSGDPNQTPENILKAAKKDGLRAVCITDHYWDERVPCNTAVNWWYEKQNHAHISLVLPLPVDEEVSVLFGCEADMDSDDRIGLSPSRFDEFDFINVSTTHFHHASWGEREGVGNEFFARRWVERFDALLCSDLPFGKVGVAHLACELINRKTFSDFLETLALIPEEQMKRLFALASHKGLGIELNYGDMILLNKNYTEVLRMFSLAKEMGCKFYLGTDAHSQNGAPNYRQVFEDAVERLGLTEDDKFIIKR